MELSVSIFLILIASVHGKPPSTVEHLTLKQFGTGTSVHDDGILYEKRYFISTYIQLTPPNARSFCKSFGKKFDLASFESRDEFMMAQLKFQAEFRDKRAELAVGGFAHPATGLKRDFYWISSGVKVFADNLIATNETMCLGVEKEPYDPVTLVPVSCDKKMKFVCQETETNYAN